jgi:hypothetical protein
LLSVLHSELGDSFSGSDSDIGSPPTTPAETPASLPELLFGPEPDLLQRAGGGRSNVHYRDEQGTFHNTSDYASRASKICAAWGVAAHRDFALPSPLTHVKQCLARTGEHLAVLRQRAGRSFLQVLWLGAPEKLLAPVQALRARPHLELAHGLSQEPPLGLRGAVDAPVLGEVEIFGLSPGAELLAAQFEDQKLDYSVFDMHLPIWGFVTATPVGRGPARRVEWHSGPHVTDGSGRQELCQMPKPTARFSPGGAALVVQSVTSPPKDAFGFARLAQGVQIFYYNSAASAPQGAQHEDAPVGSWQPRYPFALLERGVPAPTFAWSRADEVTVMATHRGALLFDTRPTRARPALRPAVRLKLPEQLQKMGTAVAGAISFDEHYEFVALNWATYDGQDRLTRRWGNVYLLEMFDTEQAARAYEPLVLRHLPDHSIEAPFRMVQFVGAGEEAIFAYGKSMYSAKMPARGDDTTSLPSHQSTGLRLLRTAERQAYLCALAERSPFFALVAQNSLRMYFPTGNRNFGRGLRRFALKEERPAYVEALAAHGVTPSPNRLTVMPWLNDSDRFMFAGLDDNCLHRWDLRPANWQRDLFLNGPQKQVAIRRPHKTPWVPKQRLAGQSLPNII